MNSIDTLDFIIKTFFWLMNLFLITVMVLHIYSSVFGGINLLNRFSIKKFIPSNKLFNAPKDSNQKSGEIYFND